MYADVTIGCNAVNELSDFWTMTCLALSLHKAAGMWQHLSEKALVWEEKWEVCEPDMLIEQGHTPNALILLSLSLSLSDTQTPTSTPPSLQLQTEGNRTPSRPFSSPSFLFSDIVNRSTFNYSPRRAGTQHNFTMLPNELNLEILDISLFPWRPAIPASKGNVLQWNVAQWRGKQRLRALTDPQRVTSSSLSSQTVLRHQPLKMLTPYFPTPASIHRLLELLKWKEVSSGRVGRYSDQTPDSN